MDERRRQPRRQADRLRPARRHLRDAGRRQRLVAGHADHQRSGVRHAAALQPRRRSASRSARDRDGLWNIWTMDGEGKNAKQISREQRWFINSPAWAPDGQYIFARRHFVKRTIARRRRDLDVPRGRSSDGLQVTESNGFQKDAGEPVISPDGRYLYYSKDVTPGTNFEYNKDPNGTIYAIIRRDLDTGRERRAVSVQGGSVTPQISARRQDARLRPARASRQQAVPPRPGERPRSRALRARRQGPAGGVGDSRPLPAVRAGRGTASRSSSGAKARSGASTSATGARVSRFRSPPGSSRR